MQVNRRHFLTTGTIALTGISLLPEASAKESSKSTSKSSSPQRNNTTNNKNISNEAVLCIGGTALISTTTLLTLASIQDHQLTKAVNEAFRKADEAEENRAAARLHLRESNIWINNQSSTC